MKKYDKIVRVKIPTIIEQNGKTCEYSYVPSNTTDGRRLIKNKLREELQELIEAQSVDEIIEESADLLEVMLCYLDTFNVDIDQLNTVRKAKRITRGKFTTITSLHGSSNSLIKLESVDNNDSLR
jgi:phosphoribosyl-ATP pyrophosphohydrolase